MVMRLYNQFHRRNMQSEANANSDPTVERIVSYKPVFDVKSDRYKSVREVQELRFLSLDAYFESHPEVSQLHMQEHVSRTCVK